MNATRLRRLCQCAIFSAVIYVFTAYLHVPSFNGYTHIGDGFLYLAASLLPTGYAAAAGAVGAGLADLLSGYSHLGPGHPGHQGAHRLLLHQQGPLLSASLRNLWALLPAAALCGAGYYLLSAPSPATLPPPAAASRGI